MSHRCAVSCVALTVALAAPAVFFPLNRDTADVDMEAHPLLSPLDEREHDFGILKPGAEATHRFKMRNVSRRTVKLALGRASCGCLAATLAPADVLAPCAHATLVLSLNTDVKNMAGKVREFVILSVRPAEAAEGALPEIHEFALTGLYEGLAPASRPYVLRGEGDLSSPPAIELLLFAHEPEPQFEVVSIASSNSCLRAQVSEMRVSVPVRNGDSYVRRVSVPVRVNHPVVGGAGKFLMQYRHWNNIQELALDAYVLAPMRRDTAEQAGPDASGNTPASGSTTP